MYYRRIGKKVNKVYDMQMKSEIKQKLKGNRDEKRTQETSS